MRKWKDFKGRRTGEGKKTKENKTKGAKERGGVEHVSVASLARKW